MPQLHPLSQKLSLRYEKKPESEPSKWSCQVEKAGCYQVHVKFGSIDLNGSPYDITLSNMALDATHCESALALSPDLTKVSITVEGAQRSVYMTPVNFGVHELRVKFNNPGGKTGNFPVYGIVDAEGPTPLTSDMKAGGNFIGFSSQGTIYYGKSNRRFFGWISVSMAIT